MRVTRRLSSPRANTDTSMWGACASPPGAGTRPGLDRHEAVPPGRRCGTRPKPGEARLERDVLARVLGVGVAPAGGWPARSRCSASATGSPVAVEDRALDADGAAASSGATSSLVALERQREDEERPDGLRRAWAERHLSSSEGRRPRARAARCRSVAERPLGHGRVRGRSARPAARARLGSRHRVEDRVVGEAAGRRGSTSGSPAAVANAGPNSEKWMCAGRQALWWLRHG